jgi:hypothetical protein
MLTVSQHLRTNNKQLEQQANKIARIDQVILTKKERSYNITVSTVTSLLLEA